jgi:hypothetical protein
MAKISFKRGLSNTEFDRLVRCFEPQEPTQETTSAESHALASATSWLKVDYFIVERAERIEIGEFPPTLKIGNWSEWQRGRLFGDKRELRWRADRERFHVVYITDDETEKHPALSYTNDQEQVVTLEAHNDLQPEAIGSNQQVYLWGEYDSDDDAWLEGRIARLLNYPVNQQMLQQKLNERQSFKERPPLRVCIIVRKYPLKQKLGPVGQEVKADTMIHRFVSLKPVLVKVQP